MRVVENYQLHLITLRARKFWFRTFQKHFGTVVASFRAISRLSGKCGKCVLFKLAEPVANVSSELCWKCRTWVSHGEVSDHGDEGVWRDWLTQARRTAECKREIVRHIDWCRGNCSVTRCSWITDRSCCLLPSLLLWLMRLYSRLTALWRYIHFVSLLLLLYVCMPRSNHVMFTCQNADSRQIAHILVWENVQPAGRRYWLRATLSATFHGAIFIVCPMRFFRRLVVNV